MSLSFSSFLLPLVRRGAAVLFLAAALSACSLKNPFSTAAQAEQAAPVVTGPAAKPAATAPAAQSASDGLNVPPPTGAKRWLGVFSPYKIDIQQGNFISQEMLAQLREGMTREQVRFVLGMPLLTDMFHANRWDYLFRLQKANGQITTNRVTVFFRDNRVVRVENTNLPNEAEYISHISGASAPPAKAPAPAAPAATTQPETKSRLP